MWFAVLQLRYPPLRYTLLITDNAADTFAIRYSDTSTNIDTFQDVVYLSYLHHAR